ncbi:serine hydrolase domain-containing protein [Amylibacter sp. IMCC11727]|uniref:serine hydrolase domain-containing protein n=1 Tax=Amylibacter sp. IMCC11727 TaxID=3039851 RepID=UPI00244E0BD0|nr:serine hydrolase domain-containing protein [Amylibacter sp. IMCC11727]WGI22567.1 serine hydrolase [Amylibacter sp. IMCC11727]
MKSLCFAVATALILPLTASAGTQLERVQAGWEQWIKDNDVTKSTITVSKGGKIIMSMGHGTDAQTPMPFASLGKAITASCTAHAINDGLFTFSDTVGTLLGDTIFVKDTNADITVGQLITHGSGLAPDQTQKPMQRWVGGDTVVHDKAAKTALSRAPQNAARNTYYYNNENYAILGRIIEVTSGQTYEAYCNEAVLKPLGITTQTLSTIYGPFAAFGGWSMSADDYTHFVIGTFGDGGTLGAEPTAYPSTALNAKVNYGMGTFWREFNGAYNHWHFGLLCFGPKNSGGSYFAYYEGKVSVVVTHNRCVDWDKSFALDAAMAGAVYNR